MKKIFMLLILSIFTLNSFAQNNNIPSKEVVNQVMMLKNAGLNLSEVQLSRITVVLMSNEEMVKKNSRTLNGNKAMLSKRLEEIRTDKINNIRGAMTPQQVEKFNELKLVEKL